MITAKLHCSNFFNRILTSFNVLDSVDFRTGYITGLAEKVYLGACNGAMMKPKSTETELIFSLATKIAETYSLGIFKYSYQENTKDIEEIWILRNEEAQKMLEALETLSVNSPGWHSIRGLLCGIPQAEIDTEFHLTHN
ncbi:MAG: hypothetical protein AABY22_36020 [Nanoarchaeota archaeon]